MQGMAANRAALFPLFGTVAQHSIDVIIAWALKGEWSSRVLFPPPEAQWPRHGHPQCIGDLHMQRAPSLTAGARACFEQGALASILYLPGIVPVFTLPGAPNVPEYKYTHKCPTTSDPTRIWWSEGTYGVSSSNITLARMDPYRALVGTVKRPPMWATNDLRVTAATSIDFVIRPNPLTQKEDLLLLSLWRRYWKVPKGYALGTWLTGVNKELGPDNEESPHKLVSPQNVEYPATADNVCSTPGLEFLGKLPPSIPIGRCAATELMLLIAAF